MSSSSHAPRAATDPGAAPRILIVDDSAVARAVFAQVLEASGCWSVSGAVASAEAALAFLDSARVEVILLDIHLPGADGLTMLPDLIAASLGAKVVAISSVVSAGAQALALGAAAALTKPGPRDSTSRFGDRLLDELNRVIEGGAPRRPVAVEAPPMRLLTSGPGSARPAGATGDFDIVGIGASTGGIHALGAVLRDLPATCRMPILVTQHLPASFMPYFAAQLALVAGRPCEVATDRMRIRPGRIVVAPGDAHLHCVALGDGGAAVRLSRVPAASGCTPSVDPMLASLAAIHGPRLLALVLSGMGRDGVDGARAARLAGACVVVQDSETSVVWGMPGAVVAAGVADAVLPPDAIGALVAAGRRPR